MLSDRGRALITGESIDAISSATSIIDAPSGEYVIVLNSSAHPDKEKLSVWADFFSGKEISIIFEDISCQVIRGDEGGLEMAKSLQSRLPENQMTLTVTDGTLLMSKAEAGRYDSILMSAEYADSFGADTLYDKSGNMVIHLSSQDIIPDDDGENDK